MTISETERASLAAQLRTERRRAGTKEGNGVEASPALEASYYRDLLEIVNRITKEVEATLVPVLEENEEKFVEPEPVETDSVEVVDARGVEIPNFKTKEAAEVSTEIRRLIQTLRDQAQIHLDAYAYFISSRTFIKGSKASRLAFIDDLKSTIGIDVGKILKDEGIESAIRTHVKNNVSLIRTIPEEYFDQIENSILQGINEGTDVFSINEDLLQIEGVSKRRARVIARDQVGKMTADFNKLRQKELGISHYRWGTAEDEDVRSSHKKLNGRRFAWDESPPGGHKPGEDIQCRCVAKPILAGVLGTP